MGWERPNKVMNEAEETRVCPHCAETIKARAKVCPHCRHCQKWWSILNPWVLAGFMVLFFIAIVAIGGYVTERQDGSKNLFSDHRDAISVVNSQFNFHIYGSNLWISVVGILTNHSEVTWKDVGVEAQFTDKTGKVFDAITVNTQYVQGVVILPHGEAAFKIEGRAAGRQIDYDNCNLTVRWARDVNDWL